MPRAVTPKQLSIWHNIIGATPYSIEDFDDTPAKPPKSPQVVVYWTDKPVGEPKGPRKVILSGRSDGLVASWYRDDIWIVHAAHEDAFAFLSGRDAKKGAGGISEISVSWQRWAG